MTQLGSTRWLGVALLLLLGVARGDDSVRLLARSTTSPTSSTLRWVHGAEAGSSAAEAVWGAALRADATDDYFADDTNEEHDEADEVVELTELDEEVREGGSVLVCRARHNGDLLPGALVGDKCLVSLAKQVTPVKRYDVLRNVEGAGRLQWRKWTRFNGRPFGAVAADGLAYVARRRAGPDARQTHYLGRLDLSVGLGRVFVLEPEGKGWVERDYQDGEVLLETEPVSYELVNVRFNERRVKLQQTPKVLATTVLRRDGEDDEDAQNQESNDASSHGTKNVATALTYWNEPSSEYWGQARGMLRGLETSIQLPGEQRPRVLAWGVNSTRAGSEQALTVQAALLPGTAQNISVTGNHTLSEIPYTARLVAHYRDGKTRGRIINGTMHQVSLQGVKVEYGAHYFLHDGSLVPTTTTTTTTTPSTTVGTTTTTIKTVAANQILDNTDDKRHGASAEDNSSMQSDETDDSNNRQAPQSTYTQAASEGSRQRPLTFASFVIVLFAMSLPFRTGT